MGKFLFKLAVFLGLNLGTQLTLLAVVQRGFHFREWQTESALLPIPEGKKFDLAFMGNSHSRIFSRTGNHLRVEKILGKSFVNLGKGGTGPVLHRIYLDYFYRRGNAADAVVYFIDAWPLSSRKWNEDCYCVADEPFRFDFLRSLISNGMSHKVCLNYYKTKFSVRGWLAIKPITQDRNDNVISDDPGAVAKAIGALYLDGFDERVFDHYALEIEKTVQLAQASGSRLIFVVPPTLFGKEPGTAALRALLERLRERYGVPFHDFSNAVKPRRLFYNTNHLNTDGVDYFTEKFLKPALLSAQAWGTVKGQVERHAAPALEAGLDAVPGNIRLNKR